MDGAAGVAQDRSGGGAREQQRAHEQREDADDRNPGSAQREAEAAADHGPDVAAVALPQREHHADEEDDHPGPEGPDVDEIAARDHQQADDHERERQAVRRLADQSLQPGRDPGTDVTTVPAGKEHGAEEDPEREQAEADQLRVLMTPRLLRPLPTPDARGHARLERASFATARHARLLRRGPRVPFLAGLRPPRLREAPATAFEVERHVRREPRVLELLDDRRALRPGPGEMLLGVVDENPR